MQSSFDSLSTTVRRLSSRYGMQERRGKDGRSQATGDDLSQLPLGQWKEQARQRYITPGKPVNHS
jgi:hypothetical protein